MWRLNEQVSIMHLQQILIRTKYYTTVTLFLLLRLIPSPVFWSPSYFLESFLPNHHLSWWNTGKTCPLTMYPPAIITTVSLLSVLYVWSLFRDFCASVFSPLLTSPPVIYPLIQRIQSYFLTIQCSFFACSFHWSKVS